MESSLAVAVSPRKRLTGTVLAGVILATATSALAQMRTQDSVTTGYAPVNGQTWRFDEKEIRLV